MGLALILLLASYSSMCFSSPKANYRISIRNQVGGHLRAPLSDLATNRFLVDVSQTFDWSSGIHAEVSGRLRSESAYGANAQSFTAEQAQRDAAQGELRDAFIQYKEGPVLLRIGNQQVVWGEAFGFFFADLVNPKDLRESSLFGLFELADLRDPIPLVDLQLRGRDWTVQLIYGPTIPKNRMPRWGAPLSPMRISDLGVTSGTVRVDENALLDGNAGDYGGRLSSRLGGLDLSVFGFSYVDRMPHYEVTSFQPVPFVLALRQRQSRISSMGLTATYDWDGYLFRFESVFTQDRVFNLMDASFSRRTAQETIGVIGLDVPDLGPWLFSVQLSHTALVGLDRPIVGRAERQTLAALRLARDIGARQNIELMTHGVWEDGSLYHTLRWVFARSSRLEFLIGAEVLEGSTGSVFGSIKEGSRVMMGLRGVFDG